MQQSVLTSTFHSLHLNYVRNSRAITVLWCVFTVCFTIINIVVFLQPWLGDGEEAKKEGYFGLFEACKYYSIGHYLTSNNNNNNQINTNEAPTSVVSSLSSSASSMVMDKPMYTYRFICDGTWANLFSSLNPLATFAVGSSALINLVCIACFLVLFLFMNSSLVFTICGVLQLISTFFMGFGCLIYPYNWGDPRIVDICETSASYYAGRCRLKWAYILAIISVFDILFLAILALVLSRRQATNYQVASTISFVDSHNATSCSNQAFSIDGCDLRSKHDTPSFRDFQI